VIFRYQTKAGPVRIVPINGHFHLLFGHEREDLGAYKLAHQAAEDVVRGHTFTPSCGIDPSTLGIPEDLGEWEQVRDWE
jgi:hypothetical protein